MCGCLSCAPHWGPLGTWPATQACAPTGSWTSNPLIHRLALNPLSHTSHGSFYIFFSIYLFIYLFFREREREGVRGRETSMCKRSINGLPLAEPPPGTWPATQACALTGNQTGDPLIHRLALNPLSHTSQGSFWNPLAACFLSSFLGYSCSPTPSSDCLLSSKIFSVLF